jgi:hypothetical protein
MMSEPQPTALSPHSPELPKARIAIMLLVVVGVILRLRQYAVRTSFSDPESYVVLNVIDHSWKALLNQLEHGQAAPPLFLWLERAAALAFGHSEYSMRLLPLVCGMLALGMFAVLARRLFSPAVALCLVAIFAFCGKFIEFGVEAKQYSRPWLQHGVAAGVVCVRGNPLNLALPYFGYRLCFNQCLARAALFASGAAKSNQSCGIQLTFSSLVPDSLSHVHPL